LDQVAGGLKACHARLVASELSIYQIGAESTAQEQTETVEKAVDCLRIITTGNDANKRALVEIPIALPGLMRLLAEPKAVCAIAAAIACSNSHVNICMQGAPPA
jgi:hypothetical protein